MSTSASVGTTQATQSVELDYDKIEKFAVDLYNAKKGPDGLPIRNTYKRFLLMNGEWVACPESMYFSKEFKDYLEANFDEIPSLRADDDATQIYSRKLVLDTDDPIKSSSSEEVDEDPVIPF